MTRQDIAREIDEIQQEMKCLDMRRDIINNTYKRKEDWHRHWGFELTPEIKDQIVNFQFKHIDPNGVYYNKMAYLVKLRDAKEQEYSVAEDFQPLAQGLTCLGLSYLISVVSWLKITGSLAPFPDK